MASIRILIALFTTGHALRAKLLPEELAARMHDPKQEFCICTSSYNEGKDICQLGIGDCTGIEFAPFWSQSTKRSYAQVAFGTGQPDSPSPAAVCHKFAPTAKGETCLYRLPDGKAYRAFNSKD